MKVSEWQREKTIRNLVRDRRKVGELMRCDDEGRVVIV